MYNNYDEVKRNEHKPIFYVGLFVQHDEGPIKKIRTYEGAVADQDTFEAGIRYLNKQVAGWRSNGTPDMQVAQYSIRGFQDPHDWRGSFHIQGA